MRPPKSADELPAAERVQHKRASQSRGTVVVVALDGVRWQEIFDGVDSKLLRAHNVPRRELVTAAELMPA